MMTNRLLLAAAASLYLSSIACGNKDDFNGGRAKEILEGSPVMLDGEQVTITQMQIDCGVQSELWDSPVQISQNHTTARLTSKGKELNFGDDPVMEPSFHQPYAQVRGAFMLQVDDVSGLRDGEEKGTKGVDASAGTSIQPACFPNPLPI